LKAAAALAFASGPAAA